jgi:hypothetical protein
VVQDALKLSNTARERDAKISEREMDKLRITELARQRKEKLIEIDVSLANGANCNE